MKGTEMGTSKGKTRAQKAAEESLAEDQVQKAVAEATVQKVIEISPEAMAALAEGIVADIVEDETPTIIDDLVPTKPPVGFAPTAEVSGSAGVAVSGPTRVEVGPEPVKVTTTATGAIVKDYVPTHTATYEAPLKPVAPKREGFGAPISWNGEIALFILEGITAPDGQYIPCIAIRDQAGYYKTDWLFGRNKEQAQRWIDEQNERLGLSPKEAFDLVLSSLRAQSRGRFSQ
jgi:hypothetical protein